MLRPFTEDEIQRIERRKQSAVKLTDEWLFLSELGYYYGYEAIRSFMNDEITFEQANMLISGGRNLHANDVIDMGIAFNAGQATKQEAFKKALDKYYKIVGDVR